MLEVRMRVLIFAVYVFVRFSVPKWHSLLFDVPFVLCLKKNSDRTGDCNMVIQASTLHLLCLSYQ
jgi:hypothetical protein